MCVDNNCNNCVGESTPSVNECVYVKVIVIVGGVKGVANGMHRPPYQRRGLGPSGPPYSTSAPPYPPSGAPFPPRGPPFPPSGLPLPPGGNDYLLPFPPPCSSPWGASFPQRMDGGRFRPKHYPESRGRGWSRGYHGRGREQQKRHWNNYEGTGSGKRTRMCETELSSQPQYQAAYCKFMFDDPWKDLLSPDEEQAHFSQLSQRFGQQLATEELPDSKPLVLDGGDGAALAASRECPTLNEQSLISPVTPTLDSTVSDGNESRTRSKIRLPPPRFTSSEGEPP